MTGWEHLQSFLDTHTIKGIDLHTGWTHTRTHNQRGKSAAAAGRQHHRLRTDVLQFKINLKQECHAPQHATKLMANYWLAWSPRTVGQQRTFCSFKHKAFTNFRVCAKMAIFHLILASINIALVNSC